MIRISRWQLIGILTAVVGRGSAAQDLPHVVIQTPLGSMEVEVDTVRAPVTSRNFLRYVDQGSYRGGRFHRTVRLENQPENQVRIEVIQGGPDSTRTKDFSPIKLERTTETGLSHRDGTISMARDGPDTATSDFFICHSEPGDKRTFNHKSVRLLPLLDGAGLALFRQEKAGHFGGYV